MNTIMNLIMNNRGKFFEVRADQWGEEANTIEYIVSGHTQITKALFKTHEELMTILEGIADDYFSTSPPPEKEGEGAFSKKEIEDLEEK